MNIKNHKGRGLKVRKLHIESFKCFDDIDIDFDERLTVIIGKNGAGKTAILESLELLFTNIMDIQLSNAARKKISKPAQFLFNTISVDDISINPVTDKFCIEYDIEVLFDKEQQRFDNDSLFNNEKELLNGKYNIKFFNDISQKKLNILKFNIDINHNFETLIADIFFDINILCYYRSTRSFPKNIKQVKLSNHNIFNAIGNSNIDYSASLAWFDAADANEARKRNMEGFRNYIDPNLNAVREAITKSLNSDNNLYEYPHMDGIPAELFIKSKKDELSYKVKNLSDGYKIILAIVMDLSRRMAMANEQFYLQNNNNILNTPAIVLIDDIENHLHPSWQQTILSTLLNIFTNTQFIVTTHSPQILTSVKPNNIRIIDNNTINEPETFSYGAESGYVLENIMKTSSRPPNEVSKYLEEYLKLVNNNEGDSSEAEMIRAELDKYIYDDPILASFDFLIFKNRYIKSQKEQ
jgi:predicted ATP-binding protein involved in virulence